MKTDIIKGHSKPGSGTKSGTPPSPKINNSNMKTEETERLSNKVKKLREEKQELITALQNTVNDLKKYSLLTQNDKVFLQTCNTLFKYNS